MGLGGGGGPSSADKRRAEAQEQRAQRAERQIRVKEAKELKIESSIERSRLAGIRKPQTLSGSLLGHVPSPLGTAS